MSTSTEYYTYLIISTREEGAFNHIGFCGTRRPIRHPVYRFLSWLEDIDTHIDRHPGTRYLLRPYRTLRHVCMYRYGGTVEIQFIFRAFRASLSHLTSVGLA
jgi:hypothetical protein